MPWLTVIPTLAELPLAVAVIVPLAGAVVGVNVFSVPVPVTVGVKSPLVPQLAPA